MTAGGRVIDVPAREFEVHGFLNQADILRGRPAWAGVELLGGSPDPGHRDGARAEPTAPEQVRLVGDPRWIKDAAWCGLRLDP